MVNRSTTAAALLAALAACGGDGTGPGADGDLALEVVVSGLSSPLYLTAPRADSVRLFVVERGGRIRIIRNDTLLATPFLDIHDDVTAGGERGLLGLAFHPGYASNGRLFVDYTDTSGNTQLVEYAVSGDPDLADAGSAVPILSVDQPYSNHNGGMLAFGPDDMLYVGLGDGGDVGDPDGNGQDSTTLLGSILRLDVDGVAPYAIPPGNPFVGHATAREEIWAYGLRNPWRFSFDRQTGDLYVADVGQGSLEEIDFQPATSPGGENYGWDLMEGTACYPAHALCTGIGLTMPVHVYGHGDGCSVTGGYVYRGSEVPALDGRYFFADFCSPWIRSLEVVGGTATDVRDHLADVTTVLGPSPQIASFGEDAAGELYVVSLGGTVYRIVAP